MASRIMISLKKALIEPNGLWSRATGGGRSLEDETIRFGASHEILETLVPLK